MCMNVCEKFHQIFKDERFPGIWFYWLWLYFNSRGGEVKAVQSCPKLLLSAFLGFHFICRTADNKTYWNRFKVHRNISKLPRMNGKKSKCQLNWKWFWISNLICFQFVSIQSDAVNEIHSRTKAALALFTTVCAFLSSARLVLIIEAL